MKLLKYLSVVGLALFLLILSSTDLSRLLELISGADLRFLLIGLLFVALEVAVRSLNWMVLCEIYAKDYGYWSAFETYIIGIAFGAVTPGKVGDFIKIGDLSEKTGLSLTKAFAIGLLDRVINLVFLVAFASFASGIIWYHMLGSHDIFVAVATAIVALTLLSIVALNERLSRALLKPLQYLLIPERFRKNTKEVFQAFHGVSSKFRLNSRMYAVLALTALGWSVIFMRPYFLGRAIGVDVPLLSFLIFIPVISLVEVLPLSIMGLGTRDATILLLFATVGVDRSRMVALSMLMLIISYAPQVILGYLVALKHRVKVKTGD